MKNLAVLVSAVAVAVFATAAFSGNAAVTRGARAQARAATLQAQVNELRSELICLTAATGDGLAADAFYAASGGGSPTAEKPVDDRGVCRKLGVTAPATTSSLTMTPAFRQLVKRAFGG